MKFRSALLILLALGLFSVVAFLVRRDRTEPRPASKPPEDHAASPGLKSARLRDFKLAEEDRTRSSFRHTFTNRTAILKIEGWSGIDRDAAGILLNDGIMGLEALYQSTGLWDRYWANQLAHRN